VCKVRLRRLFRVPYRGNDVKVSDPASLFSKEKMKNYKKLLMIIAGMPFTYGTAVHAEELPTVSFPKSTMTGIGEEEGVMRRDPSDVIKVGDLFYVWYTKGDISPGYDGKVQVCLPRIFS